MRIFITEYHPYLSSVHNMTSTKKEVREWSILQGNFQPVWIVRKDSKGNNIVQLQTSKQHHSIDMATK